LWKLQSLQGKANFLRRFIANYIEFDKDFTHFLKKGIFFIWDEVAQKSSDPLKDMLISAPLLHSPDYQHDYFLYLAAADTTIVMMLVQDDENGNKHVVYYLI